MPAWIPYTVLRLALFGGVFVILWLLQVPYWIAAIAAAIIGLTVSYIFFPGLRDRVARELAERRDRRRADHAEPDEARGEDEHAEDLD